MGHHIYSSIWAGSEPQPPRPLIKILMHLLLAPQSHTVELIRRNLWMIMTMVFQGRTRLVPEFSAVKQIEARFYLPPNRTLNYLRSVSPRYWSGVKDL